MPYKPGGGAEWVRSNYGKEMKFSDLGTKVADLLNEWAAGIYHLESRALGRVEWENPRYMRFNCQYSRLATWDFQDLTRLVFLAHDFCIRVEITPAGPKGVWLWFHWRKREGDMAERHPTLEQAVQSFRETYPIESASA